MLYSIPTPRATHTQRPLLEIIKLSKTKQLHLAKKFALLSVGVPFSATNQKEN